MKKVRRLTDEQWAKLSPYVDDKGNFDVPRELSLELPSLLDVYEDILRRVNARLRGERDRSSARVKLLEARIGNAVLTLQGRTDAAFSPEARAETRRILRFFGFDTIADGLADEAADEEENRA